MKWLTATINPELYQKMFGSATESQIEWRSPESSEEVDELMAILAATHKGQE